MRPGIVNIWPLRYGYMDFVKGTIALTELFENRYAIDWAVPETSPFADILARPNAQLWQEPTFTFYCSSELDLAKRAEMRCNFLAGVEDTLSTQGVVHVACQRWFGPKADTAPFHAMLELKYDYQKQVDTFVAAMSGGDEYTLIHCRTGDAYLDDGTAGTRYDREFVEMIRQNTDGKTVLVTDNPRLRWRAATEVPGIITSKINPVHSRLCKRTEEALDIFRELYLVIRATRIVSICANAWGASGFSALPAAMFGIPIRKINLYRK